MGVGLIQCEYRSSESGTLVGWGKDLDYLVKDGEEHFCSHNIYGRSPLKKQAGSDCNGRSLSRRCLAGLSLRCFAEKRFALPPQNGGTFQPANAKPSCLRAFGSFLSIKTPHNTSSPPYKTPSHKNPARVCRNSNPSVRRREHGSQHLQSAGSPSPSRLEPYA